MSVFMRRTALTTSVACTSFSQTHDSRNKIMYTTTQVKVYASRLRDVLSGMGHEIKYSHCLEVVSNIEGYPDWNTHAAQLNKNHERAEQYLDEVLESEEEASYEKFTRRCEKKYIVSFTEAKFLRDLRDIREDFGNYVSREFMGCVAAEKRDRDPRTENMVRYVWRGIFDKNDVLITMGIYHNDGTYYMDGCGYQ